MKPKKIFRVLVVDDNPDVIEQLSNRITPQHTIAESIWLVDKVLINAKLELDDSGAAHLSPETVSRILSECAKPFDLMLLDYGFTSPGQHWSAIPKDEEISQEFLKKTKTAADLIKAIEDYLKQSRMESMALIENFTKNFKNFAGKIYLYTYTPSALSRTYPNPDARKKRTQNEFTQAEVILVDTQHELFDNYRYENKYSSEFYAYLITGHLDNVINRELLEHVLIVQRNELKYVRVAKGGFGLFLIAIIAGGLGSASAWIGEAVLHLFKAKEYSMAWTFVGLAVIVLFLVGTGLPWILERLLTNTLTRLTSDKDEYK